MTSHQHPKQRTTLSDTRTITLNTNSNESTNRNRTLIENHPEFGDLNAERSRRETAAATQKMRTSAGRGRRLDSGSLPPAHLDARTSTVADNFDPLKTYPPDQRTRWEKRAAVAHTQPMKAIELKCCECCCWSRPEAARCEITGCPLHALNRRIFGGR